MDFKNLLSQLDQLNEATKETEKGRIHKAEPGGYGRKFDTDEEGDEKDDKKKEPAVKRGKGRPKLGADSTGRVPNYDNAKNLQSFMVGNIPKKGLPGKPGKKHSIKEWIEEVEAKYVAENVPPGMKPMAILDPKNQQAGAGVITSTNPAVQKMLGSLDPKDTKVVMTTQQQQQQQQQQQPTAQQSQAAPAAAGATGQAPAGQAQVKEKWAGDAKIHATGQYSSKSVEELKAMLAKLKKSGPHPEGSPEAKKQRQINFALRAKGGWKKGEGAAQKESMSEADIPSDQVDMGAGLGAARNAKTLESKKPDANKNGIPDYAEDGKGKNDLKKKKKVNESGHRHSAAKLTGKAHALAKEAYNCKYDDMEEARMYHEGYKEGLDECYGQMPILGRTAVDEVSSEVGDMASFGAHTPTMEGLHDDAMAGLQRTVDFAKQHGYRVLRSPAGKVMKFINKAIDHTLVARVDNEGDSINVNFEDWSSGTSGNDDASYFDQTFKDYYEKALEDHKYRLSQEDDDEFVYEVSRGEWLDQQARKPGDTFKAFGQTFHDKDVLEMDSMAFESLDRQLNALLTEGEQVEEGMTVSISKGQQGMPNTVSVSAQDSEADQLLSIIKQAGLGLFGDELKSDYGAPSDGEMTQHHDGIDVVGDHDGMMALIKKVTGAGGNDSHDYEDEDGHEGHDHDHVGEETCNECGMMESNCECEKEPVDEVESYQQEEEQIAETDLEALQKLAGTVPKREEQVAETDMEALQKLAGTVPKREEMDESNPPDSDAAETTADENAEAQEDMALAQADELNELSTSTIQSYKDKADPWNRNKTGSTSDALRRYEKGQAAANKRLDQASGEEKVTEWANDAGQSAEEFDEETFTTSKKFMTDTIAGGLNKPKSTGQTTIPVVASQLGRQVARESIADWKKLAGI